MRKGLLSCLFIVLGVCTQLSAQNNGYELQVKSYIDQYRALAVAEQKRSGIPAAITLAQGIHETAAGSSELATMANNHFGIKCKKEWTGETFAHTDDAPDECFRKYSKSEDSYKDHSDYLVKSPRYAELFKLSITDYAAWAIGLKRCGYATNPRYAQVLIKLIEDYKLQGYTYAALNNIDYSDPYANRKNEIVPEEDARVAEAPVKPAVVAAPVATAPVIAAPVVATPPPSVVTAPEVARDDIEISATPKPAYGQMVKVNGLKAIYARKGDSPLEYAYKTSIRYQKLLEINEIDERPLPMDMYLYLERKNTKGENPVHAVRAGENLFAIAQAEGILLKSLMDMNQLQAGEEPAVGSLLELQRYANKKPAIVAVKKEVPAVATKPIVKPASIPVTTTKPLAATAPPVVRTNANSKIKVSNDTLPQPKAVVAKPIEKVVPAVAPPPVVAVKETTPPAPPTPKITDPTEEEAAKETSKTTPVTKETPIASTPAPAPPTQSAAVKEVPVALATPAVVVSETPPATPVETVVVVKEEAPAKEAEVVVEVPKPIVEMEAVETVKTTPVLKTQKPAVATVNQVKVPVIEEEPKDELDKLKRQFDKVVYAKDNVRTTPTPAPVQVAVPKPDTIKAAGEAPKKEELKKALAASNDPAKYYTVKKGDTGFTIAKKHSISMKQLMDWNGLNFDAIKEGQKLRIKP